MTKIEDFKALFNTFTLYNSVLEDTLIDNFRYILDTSLKEESIDEIVATWSDMVNCLYNEEYLGDWAKYINNLILFDNNYFSLKCAKGEYDSLNNNIKTASFNDIDVLIELSRIECSDFKDMLYFKFPYDKDIIDSLASFDTISKKLSREEIVDYYKTNGIGFFAKFKAFKWST